MHFHQLLQLQVQYYKVYTEFISCHIMLLVVHHLVGEYVRTHTLTYVHTYMYTHRHYATHISTQFLIIKYDSMYLIVGIDKENYGFPKNMCSHKQPCNNHHVKNYIYWYVAKCSEYLFKYPKMH